jgi:hypothetical protein
MERPGVSNNKFSVNGLTDAQFLIYYHYTSELGCQYLDQTLVTVKRISVPQIARSGNLCKEGVVSMFLTSSEVKDAEYTWSHQASDALNYSDIASGTELETTLAGKYWLHVSKEYCEAMSGPITIADSFVAPLTPGAERTELCYDHSSVLAFPQDPDATYEWQYSTDGETSHSLTETGNSIRPGKTGFYFGVVTKGICTVTSPAKYFYIHQKDSVFVPNVFTPNGDTFNESFQIQVLHQDEDPDDGGAEDRVWYDVFNRYGKKIFSAPQNQPWHGAETDSGVYFWQGSYYSCQGEPRVVKGIVHLLK